MASRSSTTDWKLTLQSLDGLEAFERAQQQRLFRLFQSLRSGDMEAADLLLKDGAPIDAPLKLREADGGVPRSGQFAIVDLPDVHAITALGYAAAREDLVQIEWLLEHLADVAAPFAQGRDAAWVAMECRQDDAMSVLMDKGASVNHRVRDGLDTTRLIAAVKMTYVEAVRRLVNKKAKVNDHDKLGRTALHHNFMKDPYTEEDAEIGRLLIDWGGNPNMEDREGLPPHVHAREEVQYALLRGHRLMKVAEEMRQKAEAQRTAEPEEVFDHKDLVRPEPGEPIMPQINKPQKPPKPRF